MMKIENKNVELSLIQIENDLLKFKKLKNDLQLIKYIREYILEIEEKNRMMKISNENFAMMLAEYDPSLKEQLESVNIE